MSTFEASPVFRFIAKTGEWLINASVNVGALCKLYVDTVISFFSMGRRGYTSSARQIVSQILFTGVEALPIVAIVALICGVTIVIQATTNMPKFGASAYFGNIMIIVVVRELGPLLTSLIVISRSGSALAAYIGSMRVTREVAALEVVGINPVHFIVMPAFMGMVLAMTALGVYFDIIAILGGLFIAYVTLNIPLKNFFDEIVAALEFDDLAVFAVKAVLYGSVIAIISCYSGLLARTERDVPKATRSSVVWSMATTMVINVLITITVYTWLN
ncbi:MAG: ABC transporter permease [Chitinivibrionales bacterium]|nr:ABC transporter permease [Chitinivibrionales bacterium]